MNPYIDEYMVYERQADLLREAQEWRELKAARPPRKSLRELLARLLRLQLTPRREPLWRKR